MKISVQPLYPTGSYLNVRLGIEMDISPNQTTREAINEAWDALTAIHRTRYPHLYTEEGKPKYEMYKGEDEFRGTKVRDVVEDKPGNPLDSFIQAITTCTTLKSLETFKKLVEMQNVPELYEAYSQTKKRLENEQH